jgi:dolichol-phosphate mannosyltransferase
MHFAAVGVSGVFVNLAVLSVLIALGLPRAASVAAGIGVSVVTNFLLNRRFAFGYARNEPIGRQFLGFIMASAAGAAVNYAVTLTVLIQNPKLSVQLAAICGIACGMVLNYLANQFLVFRRRMYHN